MRSGATRYPVDRYLVESSNKFEMVNIIDDEIWNSEPALRPEDEIILRKLHEMLQSTADDLKLLSGELSKFHEPGIQVKTAPTPLDEEFNEKVHIEELVNAKFHGYKIIERPLSIPEIKPRNDTIDGVNVNRTKILNTDVQAKVATLTKRPVMNRNLGISRTRTIVINDNQDRCKNDILNNGKVVHSAPAVAYNEFSFKYCEPKPTGDPRKLLVVQNMPSINIRSELKEQKVLQLDIVPGDDKDNNEALKTKVNVAVVSVTHETTNFIDIPLKSEQYIQANQSTVRKISKMSACESSESTNVSSETKAQQNIRKCLASAIRNSPKTSARDRDIKRVSVRKETDKRPRLNVDEWKKKLNVVYGSSSTKKTRNLSKKASLKQSNNAKSPRPGLNNVEYIPYTQLTLGGVRVSDIEKEISSVPNNTDMPLSPILDKILSSRENSFNKESPRKSRFRDSPRILTTSDENLLQEVIDIERSVSETLSKNLKKKVYEPIKETQALSNESDNGADEHESYVDDFEDDKSEQSQNQITSSDNDSEKSQIDKEVNASDIANAVSGPSTDIKNKTFTKSTNLSYKDSVDVFEFVHSVNRQDIATQSNGNNQIIPKETQTSPRNDKQNIQPIHNDLWPTIDPRREVEKMFELEKDFIKKLIVEEYGDMLEKTINKPSTSNENKKEERKNNVASVQKNTQTSPAHVKCVMTSPRITKTRTTSPLLLSVPVNQQTSPMIFVSEENRCSPILSRIATVDAGGIRSDDNDISVNLSSPRFSLRLPTNSREVLSNLKHIRSQAKASLSRDKPHNRTFTRTTISSSSSAESGKSSSDISSVGEIKIKKIIRDIDSSLSEDSSSTVSQFSHEWHTVSILPLKSEGELSLGQAPRRSRPSKSDGETSLSPKK